jgi:hypothetical protein
MLLDQGFECCNVLAVDDRLDVDHTWLHNEAKVSARPEQRQCHHHAGGKISSSTTKHDNYATRHGSQP